MQYRVVVGSRECERDEIRVEVIIFHTCRNTVNKTKHKATSSQHYDALYRSTAEFINMDKYPVIQKTDSEAYSGSTWPYQSDIKIIL